MVSAVSLTIKVLVLASIVTVPLSVNSEVLPLERSDVALPASMSVRTFSALA